MVVGLDAPFFPAGPEHVPRTVAGMSDAQHYDVIVIGAGAGGGTIAHRPASTGNRILLLERGDYLPRERDDWESTAVFDKGKYRAPDFWYDKDRNQFPPEVNYYFGRDPESSAHDVNRRAHDLDNLYVVDTSFFPSVGAVNPSLTAVANALRVGDHIVERLQ